MRQRCVSRSNSAAVIRSPGGPFQMVRDFSPDDSFTWAPMQEGTYRVRVAIKDGFGASDTQSAIVTDEVDSRVTAGDDSFTLGENGPEPPTPPAQTIEVRPDGSIAYILRANAPEYRSFRIGTLYEGFGGQPADDGGKTSRHGGLTAGLPLAFPDQDVAIDRFLLTELCRTMSPVFALKLGEPGPETLPTLTGLVQAEGQIPPNPISPVFFSLANRGRTTPAEPSQDAVDQLFAGLGGGTAVAL
jgi:hypothetical protein